MKEQKIIAGYPTPIEGSEKVSNLKDFKLRSTTSSKELFLALHNDNSIFSKEGIAKMSKELDDSKKVNCIPYSELFKPKKMIYKITIEEVETDNPKKIEFYSKGEETIKTMFKNKLFTSLIGDAKNMELFSIQQKVFSALDIKKAKHHSN